MSIKSERDTTPNYGLVKPKQTDFYNVNDFNENMNKIDGQIKVNEDGVKENSTQIKNLSNKVENIDVSWNGITGKPATFPPNTHVHTKAQITDFPTSLPASGGNADTVDGKHASDFPLKAQGYGGVAPIWNGSNINDLPIGNYTTLAAGVPEPGIYHLVSCVWNDVGACKYQIAMSQAPSSANMYIRKCINSVWTGWDKTPTNIDFESLKSSVSSGKNAIATAITGKGISASGSDTYAALANKISQINSVADKFALYEKILKHYSSSYNSHYSSSPPGMGTKTATVSGTTVSRGFVAYYQGNGAYPIISGDYTSMPMGTADNYGNRMYRVNTIATVKSSGSYDVNFLYISEAQINAYMV